MESITMESLFSKAGFDYKLMEKNVPYDVREKNVKIRSFNHKENKDEMKKVLTIIRKDDSNMFYLVTQSGDILLKCSGMHRIYDPEKKEYVHICDVNEGYVVNSANEKIPFFVKETSEITPILDLEVEDNNNYYSNGILSHNTTPGGNAMKFYASVRMRISALSQKGDDADKGVRVSKIRVVKNKVGIPFQECEVVIKFGKGIDQIESMIEDLVDDGILVKRGSWFNLYAENISNSRSALYSAMEERPEFVKLAFEYLAQSKQLDQFQKDAYASKLLTSFYSVVSQVAPTEQETSEQPAPAKRGRSKTASVNNAVESENIEIKVVESPVTVGVSQPNLIEEGSV